MERQTILRKPRPLFWPWCAVTLACVIPLVRPLHSIAEVGAVGFFVGIRCWRVSRWQRIPAPHASLLLSQPVGGMEIWGES